MGVCLKKLCVIVNNIHSFPDIPASMRLSITLKADQVLGHAKSLRMEMERLKNTSPDIPLRERMEIKANFEQLGENITGIAQFIRTK